MNADGTVTVHNLSPAIQRKLKERAAQNNRSMEDEARAILAGALGEDGSGAAWLDIAAEFGGVDIELPERSGGQVGRLGGLTS